MPFYPSQTPQTARSLWVLILGAAVLLPAAFAQGPAGLDEQKDAMHKLAFLTGDWSGPASIARGPGEPVQATQTEQVHFKLDGLVLLVEGKATDAKGKELLSSLATIAFDVTTHTYRLRGYNGGYYIDAPLTLLPDGLSWDFVIGPAHVVKAVHLTLKGEWNESSTVVVGENGRVQSVQMLLHKHS